MPSTGSTSCCLGTGRPTEPGSRLDRRRSFKSSRHPAVFAGWIRSSDIPSWCRGQFPRVGETPTDTAQRLMGDRYPGGWVRKGTWAKEYSQIKKWASRGFQDPVVAPPATPVEPDWLARC